MEPKPKRLKTRDNKKRQTQSPAGRAGTTTRRSHQKRRGEDSNTIGTDRVGTDDVFARAVSLVVEQTNTVSLCVCLYRFFNFFFPLFHRCFGGGWLLTSLDHLDLSSPSGNERQHKECEVSSRPPVRFWPKVGLSSGDGRRFPISAGNSAPNRRTRARTTARTRTSSRT